LASSFDYDQPDVPATALADVVAEMKGHGIAPQLSPEEREQRWLANEAWREQCRQRDEQRRVEYQQEQAAKEALAERERAAVVAEANRKARQERAAEIERKGRELELRDLRRKVTQQGWWQQTVDRAANNVMAIRRQNATIADLEALINPLAPPDPEPEPEIDLGSPNIGDDNYNPRYVFDRAEMLRRRRRSWW
jgi:hypothetical protein